MKVWILPLLFLIFSACAHKNSKLCDNIFLQEGQLRLNENEKVLVCGSDKGGEGWQEVPIPQAQLHLKNLFQADGYLNPRFERKGDELYAWSGPLSTFKSLKGEGDEGLLRFDKKRKIIGEPLMPKKLNEVQRWADQELHSKGYACPTVKAEAHAWDESLLLKTDLGQRQRIGELSATGLEGLHVDALTRYQAFKKGEWYDIRKTQLTTDRLLADGLFQSAYYVINCKEDLVDLQLRASVGKPRILNFSIGASTEELPLLDLSFRNARLDDRASSFTAFLHASNIRQSLDFRSELYWFIAYPRIFFGPRFNIEKRISPSNESFSSKAGGDIGVSWDQWDVRFKGRFGPSANYATTLRGLGPEDTAYTSLDGNLTFQNNVYELFVRNQYEGWNGSLQFRGTRKGLGANTTANRYDFAYKYLWNIGSYSPPLLVLGTRIEGSMVSVAEEAGYNVRSLLPLEYRVFYGGDNNLRGFGRDSVDNSGAGYLTALYTGFELRLVEHIPYGIQPLLLWDAARMGNRAETLDKPLFLSEGFGIRWATPFGSLRGSAAHGRIWAGDETTAGYPQQWVYFVSFGQEF